MKLSALVPPPGKSKYELSIVAAREARRLNDWVRRSGVPPDDAAALRTSFLQAPAEARAAFRIQAKDGDVRFAWDEIILLGIKR